MRLDRTPTVPRTTLGSPDTVQTHRDRQILTSFHPESHSLGPASFSRFPPAARGCCLGRTGFSGRRASVQFFLLDPFCRCVCVHRQCHPSHAWLSRTATALCCPRCTVERAAPPDGVCSSVRVLQTCALGCCGPAVAPDFPALTGVGVCRSSRCCGCCRRCVWQLAVSGCRRTGKRVTEVARYNLAVPCCLCWTI